MTSGWTWLLWAPLLEEIVFRAGLHRAWLRRPEAASSWLQISSVNLGVALVFGLAHALWRSGWIGLATVPVALGIGWVFEKTGRVRDCVLIHAACNAIWLALMTTGWMGRT